MLEAAGCAPLEVPCPAPLGVPSDGPGGALDVPGGPRPGISSLPDILLNRDKNETNKR